MQPGFARWKSAISGWSKKTVSCANATKQLLVGQWTRGSIWHAEAKLPRVFVIGHACAGEWCSGHGIGAHSAAHTVTLDTLFQTASGLQGNTVQPTPPLPSHAHPLHHHPFPFATRCAPPINTLGSRSTRRLSRIRGRERRKRMEKRMGRRSWRTRSGSWTG